MSTVPSVIRDPRSGVFSVDLEPGEFSRTVQFDEDHNVDLDANGRVLSIEVLNPAEPKLEEIAARFGIEDRLPEILEAVSAAVAPVQTGTTASRQLVSVNGTVRVIGGSSASGTSGEPVPPREITLA